MTAPHLRNSRSFMTYRFYSDRIEFDSPGEWRGEDFRSDT